METSGIMQRARLRSRIAVVQERLTRATAGERADLERQLADLRVELAAAERGRTLERVPPGSEDGERRVTHVKAVTAAELRGER
jgi:head-tail adaptor